MAEIKVSGPIIHVACVKCPSCGNTNFMGMNHKVGDTVECSNCFEWFIIGGTK